MTKPDLKLAGLSIWVHNRQFESADDYWDGNWLRVTARCETSGAAVKESGSFIHLSELERWLHQLRLVQSAPTGVALLDCMEPILSARVVLAHGKGELLVTITPENTHQEHRFRFDIDNSHLPALCSQLEELLARYPLRGTP